MLVSAVLVTKVLGLVRNMLLSANYGTGIEASAFTAVSNLPLIVFDVTFGTAISAAFVPVFNEKLTNDGPRSANRFASNFLNIVLLFAAVLVALGVIFPKAAVMLVAGGFGNDAQALSLASSLMRIIMPIICFACGTFYFCGYPAVLRRIYRALACFAFFKSVNDSIPAVFKRALRYTRSCCCILRRLAHAAFVSCSVSQKRRSFITVRDLILSLPI